MRPKILLVYNAENDSISKTLDYAHKILRPSTYRCELCALTHGYFGERDRWKTFRNQSDLTIEFSYLADFKRQFGNLANEAPLALINRGQGWNLVLDKQDFQRMKSVEDLILRLSELTSEPNFSSE